MPILYSYRRCPYAMRARMALKIANISVEIREVSLRKKPAHLLQISPKGTVPVLLLPNGTVIEQSLEIMLWALQQHDPQGLMAHDLTVLKCQISQNDTEFKAALNRYKYPERYPEKPQLAYRQQGEVFLQTLENQLNVSAYLHGETPGLADIAIFPFIRQFAAVDNIWFEQSEYPKLRAWLKNWLEGELFLSVMQKLPTYSV